MSNTCSFAECERYQLAKGLCGGHYRQQHKGQALRPLRPFYGKAEAYGRDGPCRFNDLPQVRSGEWEPCSKPRDKFGLCSGHAAQHYEKRPIAPLRRYRSSCGFPGCSKPHSCGGYCAAHYWQMLKGGPLRPLNERKGWFKSGTGYIYIHELAIPMPTRTATSPNIPRSWQRSLAVPCFLQRRFTIATGKGMTTAPRILSYGGEVPSLPAHESGIWCMTHGESSFCTDLLTCMKLRHPTIRPRNN